ncbi:MAG: NADH-quinone oxidoreductase subunit C [Chloroflexi bacterium]|nr:NADH-quinone oxidoreductase subunit C [Chloroflexota bacterium]
MTAPLPPQRLAGYIQAQFPDTAVTVEGEAVVMDKEAWLEVSRFLKDNPTLDMNYLACISSVDYLDYLEVVYHLLSIKHNHSAVLKVRCYDREDPQVPSVTSVWLGADLQEREAYDLMGIHFVGHPNLKRLLTWNGFHGHPLRKDYVLRPSKIELRGSVVEYGAED